MKTAVKDSNRQCLPLSYILKTTDVKPSRASDSQKGSFKSNAELTAPTGRTETSKQYKQVRKSNSFQGYSLGSRALGCEIGQAARPPRSQRMLRRTSGRRTPTYQN